VCKNYLLAEVLRRGVVRISRDRPPEIEVINWIWVIVRDWHLVCKNALFLILLCFLLRFVVKFQKEKREKFSVVPS
jgi:hypothetical protein